MKKKPGIYETEWGNAAMVENWESNIAFDLDMGREIPIVCVTDKFIGEID